MLTFRFSQSQLKDRLVLSENRNHVSLLKKLITQDKRHNVGVTVGYALDIPDTQEEKARASSFETQSAQESLATTNNSHLAGTGPRWGGSDWDGKHWETS